MMRLTRNQKRGIKIGVTVVVAIFLFVLGGCLGAKIEDDSFAYDRSRLTILESQVSQKETEYDELEKENSELQEKYTNLRNEYNSLKQEYENSSNSSTIEELQAYIDELELQLSTESTENGETITSAWNDYITQVFYSDGNLYHVEDEDWTFYSDTMLQNPIGNDIVVISPVIKDDDVKNGGLTHHIYTVRTENGLVYSSGKPRLSNLAG
mgnify:CR=1 FL=1